jgi:hypothetical protein
MAAARAASFTARCRTELVQVMPPALASRGIFDTKQVRGLIEAGWPIHHVQEMSGHASLEQTSTYLNVTRVGLHESMRRFERAGIAQQCHRQPRQTIRLCATMLTRAKQNL